MQKTESVKRKLDMFYFFFIFFLSLPSQAEDEESFYQMKLKYFDNLLKENRSGRAVCENPRTAQPIRSIPVTCAPNHILVALPIGAQLHKVSELGKQ